MSASVQYRLTVSKSDERVAGPDDADIVFTATPKALESEDGTVAYMRGQLKATGNTGDILELLKSGEAMRQMVALSE